VLEGIMGKFSSIIGISLRIARDHKKVPKQDEDTGNLQILLH